jgi:lipoprotein-anchoring transpeptidase ErfK/SrfK
VFQYRPEVLFTDEPIVRLMPIGQAALADRVGSVRADGKRGNGGGDRRAGAWRALAADAPAVERTVADGGVYVEATGHTVSGVFLEWYERHEGAFYLGNPLGEPVTERGRTAQWFEGGVLLADAKGVRLLPLAREMAPKLGVETARVERAGLPDYRESLFVRAPNPTPNTAGRADAAGPKRIEVDLSEQRLWAYQGDAVVTSTLVTTGLEPNTTEQGRFRVRLKYREQDMAGFTDSTGEVVAGDDGTEGTVVPGATGRYEVPDVPDVMYFNMEAEALHGAYWRDVFGAPGSHGCVNLPLEMAAFLYEWAPLGTPVWVHE